MNKYDAKMEKIFSSMTPEKRKKVMKDITDMMGMPPKRQAAKKSTAKKSATKKK